MNNGVPRLSRGETIWRPVSLKLGTGLIPTPFPLQFFERTETGTLVKRPAQAYALWGDAYNENTPPESKGWRLSPNTAKGSPVDIRNGFKPAWTHATVLELARKEVAGRQRTVIVVELKTDGAAELWARMETWFTESYSNLKPDRFKEVYSSYLNKEAYDDAWEELKTEVAE